MSHLILQPVTPIFALNSLTILLVFVKHPVRLEPLTPQLSRDVINVLVLIGSELVLCVVVVISQDREHWNVNEGVLQEVGDDPDHRGDAVLGEMVVGGVGGVVSGKNVYSFSVHVLYVANCMHEFTKQTANLKASMRYTTYLQLRF